MDMPSEKIYLIILAGGESSRLWPLREKSMIRFFDRPILEHQLETFARLGFQDVLVVCHAGNEALIRDCLSRYEGRIRYDTSVQAQARGMGDALLTLQDRIDISGGPAPVMISQVHDIVDECLYRDLLQARASDARASWLAAYEVDHYFPGGYLQLDRAGKIVSIIEKPGAGNEPSNLVSLVAHIHPDFARLLDAIRAEYESGISSDDHYERAMDRLMKEYPFKPVSYSNRLPWCPIKFPWHVLDAMEQFYLARLEERIPAVEQTWIDPRAALEAGAVLKGAAHLAEGVVVEAGAVLKGPLYVSPGVTIEGGAYLQGPLFLGEGVRIESGVTIRGPVYIAEGVRLLHGADVRGRTYLGRGVLVGQYATVRGSMVSQNCTVGVGSEIVRSYLGQYTEMHTGTLLDSVTADASAQKPTNVSKLAVTYNLRADRGKIKSTVKGALLDTGRDKLGAIIGSGAFISGGAMPMPGVKIGENAVVGPGTVLLDDVPDGAKVYQKQALIRKTPSASR